MTRASSQFPNQNGTFSNSFIKTKTEQAFLSNGMTLCPLESVKGYLENWPGYRILPPTKGASSVWTLACWSAWSADYSRS